MINSRLLPTTMFLRLFIFASFRARRQKLGVELPHFTHVSTETLCHVGTAAVPCWEIAGFLRESLDALPKTSEERVHAEKRA